MISTPALSGPAAALLRGMALVRYLLRAAMHEEAAHPRAVGGLARKYGYEPAAAQVEAVPLRSLMAMAKRWLSSVTVGAVVTTIAASVWAQHPVPVDPARQPTAVPPNAPAYPSVNSRVDGRNGAVRPKRITDYPCFLSSDTACREPYPLIELGMGWGESLGIVGWQWHYRLWAEVGVMVPIAGERDLHIGPVFNFGGDFGRETGGYSANLRVKVRYWVDGSPIHLDLGAGPSFARYAFHQGSASGRRLGGTTDMSLGVLGMVSVYGATTYHIDMAEVDADEVRLLAGIRGSLLPWGLALAAIGQGIR